MNRYDIFLHRNYRKTFKTIFSVDSYYFQHNSVLMFQIKTNENWCLVIVSMAAICKIVDYRFWLKPVTCLVGHSKGFSPSYHSVMDENKQGWLNSIGMYFPIFRKARPSFFRVSQRMTLVLNVTNLKYVKYDMTSKKKNNNKRLIDRASSK